MIYLYYYLSGLALTGIYLGAAMGHTKNETEYSMESTLFCVLMWPITAPIILGIAIGSCFTESK
jgi:hypothetical protein